jgi:hypothetical protein
MKENDKMVWAMAISGAVTGGILNYQNQTKEAPPEPVPVVQTQEQPQPPEAPKASKPQAKELEQNNNNAK